MNIYFYFRLCNEVSSRIHSCGLREQTAAVIIPAKTYWTKIIVKLKQGVLNIIIVL